MVKLNRIYTRTGDAGTTGLVDGSRVSKAAAVMQAIGDVDEAIGVSIAALQGAAPADRLLVIQNDLFDLGADIATPMGIEGALRIVPAQVARLEAEIDAMNEGLSPLTSFILPGGTPAAAALHLARAIVRRAERSVVTMGSEATQALAYLNRLSDWLFVATRVVNGAGEGDVLWKPGASR